MAKRSASKRSAKKSARKKTARTKQSGASAGKRSTKSRKTAAPKKSAKKSPWSSTPKKPTGPQRLQRLLAAAGYGSRRQCEDLIEEGRVMVDGDVVTKLGTTVDPKKQKVSVDGVNLRAQKKVYYAVNKPTGIVTTNRDPRGRARVIDFVPNSERVFPVGRLDMSSEGLILLTNDGDLAQQLAHPKYGVRKVYRVTVAGKVEPETMRKMRQGIYIAEGLVRVEGARILKSRPRATELEIVLREGKNREIRRILARMGHKVQTLRRIAIGPLRLGDVPPGAYRVVSREEVRKLQAAAEASRVEAESAPQSRRAKPAKRKSNSQRTETSSRRQPRRNGKSRAKPEFEIELTSFDEGASTRVGAVIGGEGPEEPKQKPKRSAGKRSSTPRGAKKKRGGKGAKRSSTSKKPSGSRRGGASAKKTRRGGTSANKKRGRRR